MIKALIFDMDGTLIDNMRVHYLSWQEIILGYGLELPLSAVIVNCHGLNEDIVERFFPNRFSLLEKQRISYEKELRYRAIFQHQIQPIAGLTSFLQKVHAAKIPMGIGTAAPKENVDFVLETLRLRSYFSSIKDASDVEKGKPDPSVFLKVADNFNVNPENCLVFEDSLVGAQAALNAGMKTIIVTTTLRREDFSVFSNIVQFIDDYTSLVVDDIISA
jgi:beta-phosphoglucomutase